MALGAQGPVWTGDEEQLRTLQIEGAVGLGRESGFGSERSGL